MPGAGSRQREGGGTCRGAVPIICRRRKARGLRQARNGHNEREEQKALRGSEPLHVNLQTCRGLIRLPDVLSAAGLLSVLAVEGSPSSSGDCWARRAGHPVGMSLHLV